ncbi:MAG: SIS domain-containing protein [Microgenomates group bacterium]
MAQLDDIEAQIKLDVSQTYESIVSFPKQCQHAFDATANLVVPASYKDIDKILMTGMGGSGLGARIIESVYASNLKYPVIRYNGYGLPAWVDDKTLVICSSFSGTTEETISNAKSAIEKKMKWMAISAGAELIALAKAEGVPYYQIEPTYNPSKQPRLAIGYSVVGQLRLVAADGIISFGQKEIDASVARMNSIIDAQKRENTTVTNPAKQLASAIAEKQVIFVGASHLIGAIHTIKNQMNENAKHLSHLHEIPELNHHLMEGLAFPAINKESVIFFLIVSDSYSESIKKRFAITKDVIEQNGIEVVEYHVTAGDALVESFDVIQFGALINYYLSMLHNIDPAPIPWVDYFKTQLGQPLGEFK